MNSKTHEIWNIHFIEQIIDAMADGVFTLDNSGRVTSWNPSMERISGYAAEEAMGNTCQILKCSRCFGKKCPSGIRSCQILKEGQSGANECLLMHRAGHNVPVIKNARVVRDENQRIIGVVETVTDLSEISRARQEAEEALIRLGEKHRLDNLIGKSHEMQKVFASINAAAASDATILIMGESGTGKELVAGAIHQRSVRTTYPLIAVNCSALTESLLESELFGQVFPIVLPLLRKRKEDIPLLTRHFIDRQNHKTGKNITGISQYAMRVFLDHSWPGNVRELENAIEHAFVLCNRDQIEISDLPLEIRQPGEEGRPGAIAGVDTKKIRIGRDLSKEELVKLLETYYWNKAEVARRLGVSRTAVWKYMKKWDIPLKNTG